jgi:hypothetical protein
VNKLYGNCALIIGHPGHELRVWGWMSKAQPLVVVLTDGSGHQEQPRLESSLDLFKRYKAIPSNLSGLVSDKEIYQSILTKNFNFFLQWSDLLAEALIKADIHSVVGDMIEGYNPTHDLCRIMIDRAVKIANKQNKVIKNYEFPLNGSPLPTILPSEYLRIDLSPSELASKLADVHAYAELAGGALLSEVKDLSQRYGDSIWGQEFLLPAKSEQQLAQFDKEKPFYETYGEKQVAQGHYQQVIRYHEHIAPIINLLNLKEPNEDFTCCL